MLYDGPSGANGGAFNAGAHLPWGRKGGDWIDADGVLYGARAFASKKVVAVGAFTLDVTAIVQTGDDVFIRASGACVIASRRHATPEWRPVLVADGVEYPCTASARINVTTTGVVGGDTMWPGDTENAAFAFAGPASCQKAEIRLYCTKSFSGGATLAVHRLARPSERPVGAVELGLAAAFPLDAGIEAHPDVYFATDLADPADRFAKFPEGAGDSRTVVEGPAPGTHGISATYRVGTMTPMVMDHRWSWARNPRVTRNPSNGLQLHEEVAPSEYLARQHPGTPEELYFRYYVRLHADYQCATEGKKLPGLAGRYGQWSNGQYTPVDGNGGAPTKGKVLPTASGGRYLSGWSMRSLAMIGTADADNPLRARVAACTYAYHAAMKDFWGDNWRWGSPDRGYAFFLPDEWHCVEQRVRLNTLAGPFDADGNGVGNPDGILEIWFDGIKVLSRADVVYRHHPAIKIDEVWNDHYHGGTKATEAPHTFSLAGFVVARSYIGPMNVGNATNPEGDDMSLQSAYDKTLAAVDEIGAELGKPAVAAQLAAGVQAAADRDAAVAARDALSAQNAALKADVGTLLDAADAADAVEDAKRAEIRARLAQ